MPDIVPQSNKAPPQKTLWAWETAEIGRPIGDTPTFIDYLWHDDSTWFDKFVWKEK